MSDAIDIINMDNQIYVKLEKEGKMEKEYLERMAVIKNLLEKTNNPKLQDEYKNLCEKVKEIQTNDNLNFYIAESAPIIEAYKNILKTPIKLSFMGKPKYDPSKDKIIAQYLQVAKKYLPHVQQHQHNAAPTLTCDFCKQGNFVEVDYNTTVCMQCGNQKETLLNSVSYKDADRVNVSQKYTYESRIHFRDCINQYQGKQNSNIDPKVYEDLENEYQKYKLLNLEPGISKQKKFERVTKDHLILFLRELGYDKHYDNANLIYSTQTGTKCDDISHLDSLLMNDFDTLIALYDKRFKHERKIDRKNFINTQYVLYQLLNHHKHPCKPEDFIILKTIDRQTFHDDICKALFEELGWNHTPYF